MNITQAQQFAPLVSCWSLLPNKFYYVEQDKSIGAAGDDSKYVITETTFDNDEQKENVLSRYKDVQWEETFVEVLNNMAISINKIVRDAAGENKLPDEPIPFTVIGHPDTIVKIFTKILNKVNEADPTIEDDNGPVMSYSGTLNVQSQESEDKVVTQIFDVFAAYKVAEDIILLGNFDHTKKEFNVAVPVGKIVVKE